MFLRLKKWQTIASVLLGLAGFCGAFFALSYYRPPLRISVTWSYFLPILAALAYGGRYGLVAGVVGLGAFFPFFLWPTNGYANLASSGYNIAWFVWMGWCAHSERRRLELLRHPFVAYFLFALVYVLTMRLAYESLTSLNPPFWMPEAPNRMPDGHFEKIMVKQVITMFLTIIPAAALLRVNVVRRALKLEQHPEAERSGRVILISFAGALVAWCALLILDRILVENTFPAGMFRTLDPHEVVSAIILLSAGILVGTIVADAMERQKRVELLLRVKRDELAASVERLARAQKLESIGVLAGGIAHDFNNLLGGIFGHVEIARVKCERNNPQDARVMLEKAAQTLDRATALTRQLLTFSKGGAPRREVRSIGPLIEASVTFCLSGSNVEARLSIPEDLWPCLCDDNQISQVIDNLVINAAQAMSGGGLLTVTAENRTVTERPSQATGEERFVCVTVRDSGPGIPLEIRDKVFDPFFTTREEGSGLGLATAHSIVTRHGGRIRLLDGEAMGAAVEFSLPAARGPVGDADLPPVPCGLRHTGAKILVLDDEEALRDVLRIMVGNLGYAVVTASTGEDALAQFRAAEREGEPFSVCLLDLTVRGGMGGRETAAELRKIRADIRIAAASGYSDDPVMAEPERFGFDDSVAKPFMAADLEALLARLGV
jgi:signal transduction histidine kinase/CheY-like chemotaxis protein